jgi:hypothetical protein
MSYINPVHTFTWYFLEISIFAPATHKVLSDLFPSGFPVEIFHVSCAYQMPPYVAECILRPSGTLVCGLTGSYLQNTVNRVF